MDSRYFRRNAKIKVAKQDGFAQKVILCMCLPIVFVELSLVGGRRSQKIPIIDLDISREEARKYPLEVFLNTDYAVCATLCYGNTPKLLVAGLI